MSMDILENIRCELIVGAGLVALMIWSVTRGNTVIAVVAVVGAMIILYFCKRRGTEVLVDERTYKIGEQSARRTLQVFSIASGVTGILLVVLSQYGYPEVAQVGLTLAYSACALLVLYSLFYRYYNKKYGI